MILTRRVLAPAAAVIAVLSVAACTNPYDPTQRAVGGGLLGAGTGAAIGGLVGGGRGAALGAVVGGGAGALGGAATTPQPAPPPGYYSGPPSGYYNAPPPGYYPPPPPPPPAY